MELRDYIEQAAKKAGGITALSKKLDLALPQVSNIKAGVRPLPMDALFKLADYIDADLKALIAANELVTEKKEEKRAYWRPFAEQARAITITTAMAVCILTVSALLTPTPAEACNGMANATNPYTPICIM
jgi:hypothetical protein